MHGTVIAATGSRQPPGWLCTQRPGSWTFVSHWKQAMKNRLLLICVSGVVGTIETIALLQLVLR
jgi:hypothetical protein